MSGVNWGLATQNQFNPMQVLQAAGIAQQQQMAQQQADAQRQQQQARQMAAQQAAGGDYSAAQQTALQSGDFDLAGTIRGWDDNQRKQAMAEAETIARVAYGLRQLPPQDRMAAFQANIPALRAQGFSDQEIQAAGQDLSDGVLDGYVRSMSDIQQQFQRMQPDYQVVGEGDVLVNTRDPNAVASIANGQQQQDLEAMAQQAIAAGADPAAVRARMQQLQGGGQTGAPSGGFPQ